MTTATMRRGLAPAVLADVEQLATLTEQAAWLHRLAGAVRADAEATVALLVAEAAAREARMPDEAVWPLDVAAGQQAA